MEQRTSKRMNSEDGAMTTYGGRLGIDAYFSTKQLISLSATMRQHNTHASSGASLVMGRHLGASVITEFEQATRQTEADTMPIRHCLMSYLTFCTSQGFQLTLLLSIEMPNS